MFELMVLSLSEGVIPSQFFSSLDEAVEAFRETVALYSDESGFSIRLLNRVFD